MTPYYVKLAASKLSTLDVVKNVSIRQTVLIVDFVTGQRERFCFAGKPKQNTWTGFQWSVTDKELRFTNTELPKIPGSDCLRILPRSLLVNISLITQRILVHRMIKIVCDTENISVPQQIIRSAVSRLAVIDFSAANKKSLYDFSSPKRACWAPLWVHHYYRRSVERQLSKRITNEILNSNKDVSIIDVLYQLGRSYGSPTGYASLFDTIGVKSVLDLHPDCGKMLGCAIAGIRYSAIPSENLDRSLNQGIIENVGLDYYPYTENLKADIIICDHSLQKFGLDDIKSYSKCLGESRWKFMAWCDRAKAKELSKLPRKSKPKLVPIRLSKSKPTSYITLW